MKKILFTAIISAAIFTSCDKDRHKVTIERDCSGTYVQLSTGADLKVCNESILEGYNDGAQVKIKYENMEQCFGLVECELLHVHDGAIEITEVKK